MPPLSRRTLVRQGGLALLALGLPPAFLTRSLLAETRAPRKKTLICIFQRGAVDGLHMVVPFAEKAYHARRRATALPAPSRNGQGVLELDGFFGLHPALGPLHELYSSGELALVHAVGSPHPTRSHFDAQDFMETATPGVKSTREGWLNRVLQATGCAGCEGRTLADGRAHAADHEAGQVAMASGAAADAASLRGVAMGSALPLALRGAHPALAIEDLARFGVAGGRDAALEETFARVYRTDAGSVISGAADEAFQAIELLKRLDPQRYAPAPGVSYPAGEFGRALSQIAQLVKADAGVEIAFADLGGWDTHQVQGGLEGQLATRLGELGRGLRALHDDLGDRMDDVVVMTMSEFGRTVAENGSGGTDHGHATCMMVLGGGVKGGRVLGEWPGLEPEQLHEGRDLAVTTDFRDVFGEVVMRHLGANEATAARVFPGYGVKPAQFRGILRG